MTIKTTENSAFAITGIDFIVKYIQNKFKELMLQNATVFSVFLNQINTASVSLRYFFQKHAKKVFCIPQFFMLQ